MALYQRKNGKGHPTPTWWMEFRFRNKLIRKSTKTSNKRQAEQIEAAYKTNLARGLVNLPSLAPIPTLAQFIERDLLPSVKNKKPKTRRFYEHHSSVLSDSRLGPVPLDTITPKMISHYADEKLGRKYAVSTVNRDLGTLRRIFHLAKEAGKLPGEIPKFKMLPGENRRERVISEAEEKAYLDSAQPLLKDVATLLFDLGLRPEEAFRLTAENFQGDEAVIFYGKGRGSRRRLPCSDRVLEVVNRRLPGAKPWLFPNPDTKSGHIEESSIRKQHNAALKASKVARFVIYSIRHSAVTRTSTKVDAFRLQYWAGHIDIKTTARYAHPDPASLREAILGKKNDAK